MSITADYHMHTSFSGDCDTPMEDMILKSIQLGLTEVCFTEHMDFDFPEDELAPGTFEVNTDSYLYDFLKLKEKYFKQIKLHFGIELGLQPHLSKKLEHYVSQYPFDFIIGSSHLCNGKDPYYPDFYKDRSEEESYREYFQSEITNIKKISAFDVYGHLDYVVRYGPNKDRDYTYEKYKDLINQILEQLISNGKGLEINTGGYRKGLKDFHPSTSILKQYRKLGGEIITIGSDAHITENVAQDFNKVAEVLESCGFHYYTIYENRIPKFKKF